MGKFTFNVKFNLNRSVWSKFCKGSSSFADYPPIFKDEFNISKVKFNNTWKTTSDKRNTVSNDLVCKYLQSEKAKFVDVGASSGVDLISIIDKSDNTYQFILNDITAIIDILYVSQDNYALFLEDKCFMVVTKNFIFYSDYTSILYPLNIFSHFVRRYYDFLSKRNPVSQKILIEEHLNDHINNGKLIINNQDYFTEVPTFSGIEVLRAANLLNAGYFSDNQVQSFLSNVTPAIKLGGKLVLSEYRNYESCSVFEKIETGYKLIENINGGAERERQVLDYTC